MITDFSDPQCRHRSFGWEIKDAARIPAFSVTWVELWLRPLLHFMDDDSADIQTVAQEVIARRGEQAVGDLLEMAEIAAGNGDQDSAQTWREIAAAAQVLLNSHRQL